MRAPTVIASVAVAVLAAGVASGCGGDSGAKASAGPSSPSAVSLELQKLAAASRDSLFTATYAAKAVGNRSATVSVYVQNATTYRVDIAENNITASLYGTANGSVACSVAAGVAPACFLVAAPGKPIPAPYDAGVERVFTRDLPALAAKASAFTIAAKDALAVEGALPAARCFSVAAARGSNLFTSGLLDDVDLGTYCLSASGPPRRLDFASGSLALQSVGPAPTVEQLTPPAAATPLPSPTATPTASASAPFGLLGSASPTR